MIKPVQDGLVSVKKLTEESGCISINGRYTTRRTLQSDYRFEMSWNSQKVIGTGMSGPVRLAVGNRDGRKYAVKSFKKKQLNATTTAELKSEVEIYLSLDHPHIARLEQVYETDEEIHLVMEYMAGGELYDSLKQLKAYTEEASAHTAYQMLLAVSYLHSRNICHRDLKLENFLYEGGGSDHLKLIDFGFAKICRGSTTLSQTCGSIHYVAPEVLKKSYTSQADMWSLGVVSHMLLTGSPVFRGQEHEIISLVKKGKTRLSSKFSKLSVAAQGFVQALLVVDPTERMTAKAALGHPFVAHRACSTTCIDVENLHSFQNFASASRFRRVCLSMMAWSLSQEDRQKLRSNFLQLDVQKKGTISLLQFKLALCCHIKSNEAEHLFAALDMDHDDELCYSEFLAAAIQGDVCKQEHVLRRTFARFDQDDSGTITVEDLRLVLGDTFENVGVMELINEVDETASGCICYDQFAKFLQEPESDRGTCKPVNEEHLLWTGEQCEQWPVAPLPRKSFPLTPNKGERAAFHNSLMRAAAEAAASCVRLPK